MIISSASNAQEISASKEDAVWSFIRDMDFSKLLKKISGSETNVGIVWPREAAEKAVEQYKRFLFLQYKYQRQYGNIQPSMEMDEIWHGHILDTARYHQDCQRIFGEYMHHNPYPEKHGDEALELTKRLYLEEFAEPLTALIEFES